ncbi:MAG: hypothetical protein AMXMBFR78_32890 [Rubrivivax sp.]|jgi:sigma-E factor negative regulatory protein RseA
MRNKPLPPPDPDDPPPAGERLSSLIDGEGGGGELDAACRCWRTDADLRRDWQLYHLIGDVLRSDELSPARPPDARFLEGLRERIAREPVPLAPGPLPAPPRPPLASAPTRATRRWPAPTAMAAGLAGVMVVGSAVVLMRPDASAPAAGWGEQAVSAGPAAPRAATMVSMPAQTPMPMPMPIAAAPRASEQPMLVRDRQLIRDARLDAYIDAHRGALAPLPVAMPGAWPRDNELLAPQR